MSCSVTNEFLKYKIFHIVSEVLSVLELWRKLLPNNAAHSGSMCMLEIASYKHIGGIHWIEQGTERLHEGFAVLLSPIVVIYLQLYLPNILEISQIVHPNSSYFYSINRVLLLLEFISINSKWKKHTLNIRIMPLINRKKNEVWIVGHCRHSTVAALIT